MNTSDAAGRQAEELAARYLVQKGYQIVARRFRSRQGEIDLIARDGRTLVFVEVKYRRSRAYGNPAEAVDGRKQHTICRVSDYYRMTHGISEDQPCRFDVAAIEGDEVCLIRNAFPYQ